MSSTEPVRGASEPFAFIAHVFSLLGNPVVAIVSVAVVWTFVEYHLGRRYSVLVLAAVSAVTWIGGSNGVGKTTLLRVLAGLIGPTEGHVRMFGLHPEHDRRAYQQHLSFLPATSTGLHARLTVRRQHDYTARINFVPREQRPVVVEESIKRFSLTELAGHRVDRLSMG